MTLRTLTLFEGDLAYGIILQREAAEWRRRPRPAGPEVDPAEPARDHHRDVRDVQDGQQVQQPPARRRLAVVVAVGVDHLGKIHRVDPKSQG